MTLNIETLGKQMVELSSGIVQVKVDWVIRVPGETPVFLARLSSEVPKAAVLSLCRGWAELIRKVLPDRHDDFSSVISVILPLGSAMGVYCVGRIGHEDVWYEDKEQDLVYDQAWDRLHRELEDFLRVRGKSDWEGKGDYFLFDECSGYRDQSLTIYQIEFLTAELVSGIQGILMNGYTDWSVYIVLDLIPPVDGIGSKGLEIFADRIVDRWDRSLVAERLGDRLKL
jgi:hypothetical protein